jgi:hypothetical protein
MPKNTLAESRWFNMDGKENTLWDSLGGGPTEADLTPKVPAKGRVRARLEKVRDLPTSAQANTQFEKFCQENVEILNFLRDYQGSSDFLNSIRSQLDQGRVLSPKQIDAVAKNLIKAAPKAVKIVAPSQAIAIANPTYPNGSAVTIKQWYAKILMNDLKMSHLYRNIEILETYKETEKAVQVRIRFTPRYSTSCACCGLTLENQVSRATGIGPICADKMGIEQYSLENAKEVLKQIEAKLGAIGDQVVWIPRRQIKGVVGE